MPVMIVLLLWPLIEIAGFAGIGGLIGIGPTLGFVLVSGLFGLALLRRAGFSILARLRAAAETGAPPVPAALDGAWRILAGVLLVLPGFFSSAIGLILLFPPIRLLLTRIAAKYGSQPGRDGIWTIRFGGSIRRQTEAATIDGEFHELPPKQPELPPR